MVSLGVVAVKGYRHLLIERAEYSYLATMIVIIKIGINLSPMPVIMLSTGLPITCNIVMLCSTGLRVGVIYPSAIAPNTSLSFCDKPKLNFGADAETEKDLGFRGLDERALEVFFASRFLNRRCLKSKTVPNQ